MKQPDEKITLPPKPVELTANPKAIRAALKRQFYKRGVKVRKSKLP